MAAEVSVATLLERIQDPKNAGSLQKLEKQRKQILLRKFQKELALLKP